MSKETERVEQQRAEAVLRQALREPVPLPYGFAERVLTRALGEEARRRSRWHHAIAASLLGAAMLGAAAEGLYR